MIRAGRVRGERLAGIEMIPGTGLPPNGEYAEYDDALRSLAGPSPRSGGFDTSGRRPVESPYGMTAGWRGPCRNRMDALAARGIWTMMRFARAAALGGCATALLLTGCVQLTKEGVVAQRTAQRGLILDRSTTQSSEEHMHSLAAVVDEDAKGLVEDLDIFMQRDRPTRLTRWHER